MELLQTFHALHSGYVDFAIAAVITGLFAAALRSDYKARRRNRYRNEGFGR